MPNRAPAAIIFLRDIREDIWTLKGCIAKKPPQTSYPLILRELLS
jgi:hypothetical protein